MKAATNASSMLSGNTLRDPEDGDVFSYGGRPTLNPDGSNGVDRSYFAGLNMTAEKDGMQNSWWGNDLLRQFFNRVSKVHDYGNSWAYDTMGNWISHGRIADTLFNVYSASTMIPAAIYTATAYYGSYIGTVFSAGDYVKT